METKETTPTRTMKVMRLEMTKAKEEILVVSKAMMVMVMVMMRIRTEGPSLHRI